MAKQEPEEWQRRNELYLKHKETHEAIRLSNFEKADAAILTLASLGLTLSVSFLKDIVTPSEAVAIGSIIASWVLLALSIVCTLLSFYSGRAAADKADDISYDYYINNNDAAFDNYEKKNPMVKITSLLNFFGAAFFVVGLGCIVAFSWINFVKVSSVKVMSDEKVTFDNPPPKKDDGPTSEFGVTPSKPRPLPTEKPQKPVDNKESEQK